MVSIISYIIREPELIFRLAPTHVFASFDDDNSNSVVPVKLKNDGKGDSKVGTKRNGQVTNNDTQEQSSHLVFTINC